MARTKRNGDKSTKTDPAPPERPNLRALGRPPTAKLGRLLAERTFELEPGWLPAGLWPDLDALREEHHRRVERLVGACQAVERLAAKFATEDERHSEALRQAHREGKPAPADKRASPDERGKRRTALVENGWAALAVLAEHVERVVAVLREHEDEWLSGLEGQLPRLADERREIMARLAPLDAEEWRLYQQANWLKVAADDGLSGRQQPAPTAGEGPRPPHWHRDPYAFERHFTKLRPWNRGYAEAEQALRADREGDGPQITTKQKRAALRQGAEISESGGRAVRR